MQRNRILLVLVATMALATSSAFACGSFGVTGAAAMAGSTYGLQADFDGADLNSCYVQNDSPSGETIYSAFFRMRVSDTYEMTYGAGHDIFRAIGTNGTINLTVIQAKIRYFNVFGGTTYVQVNARRDDGSWSTPLVSIAPGQAGWKFDWQAASAPGANDGFLRLMKRQADGSFACIREVLNIDNDLMSINSQRLGAMGAVASTTLGAMHFDTFESYRTVDTAPPACDVTYFD